MLGASTCGYSHRRSVAMSWVGSPTSDRPSSDSRWLQIAESRRSVTPSFFHSR
jgi:hypothetical protein